MAMKWNNKRSTRFMWSALVITTFALCALFAFVILNLGTNYSFTTRGSNENIPQSEKLTEEECIPVCSSDGCILQSKLLLDHIQPSINPCDNFHKFTCGRFPEKFPDGSWVLQSNKKRRIKSRNILENLEPMPNSASDKMKIVYDSCISPDSEIEAVPSLLQILEEFGFKDWPHLPSDFQFGENYPLAKVIANLLLHEEYGFIALSREDNPIAIPYTLQVTIGSQIDPMLALNTLEEASNEGRKLQIDRILKYFNLEAETVTKIQEEREAMDREIERLKKESEFIDSSSLANSSHVDCSRKTENEWTDLCEVINWFLNIAEVNGEVSRVSIESENKNYVQNIFPLLRNFSDRAVANYLAIDVILNHLNDLNLYFRLTYQKDVADALKIFELFWPIDRWQSCVDWIAKRMSYALLYEYGKKDFTVAMFKEIANLTTELIHDVAEFYSLQTHLPEDFREQKAKEIRNYTLLSPTMKFFPSGTTVNNFYYGFKPKNGNFLHNVMEFRKFKTVGKMRNKFVGNMHEREIFTADAYGAGGFTEIGLALLQPPHFSLRYQRIFNLVPFGFYIVHEIGHSMFDHRDFQLTSFMKRLKCLQDQVSQYKFELIGKNLIGEQYVWEDLADNVALLVTDKIIEKYISEGVESFLPGLPYPTKQLLYIKSGLLFCSANWKRKEELYSLGTHSPDDVRIYQRGRNSKLFPEVFDCPVGSFMNPEDKCRVLSDG